MILMEKKLISIVIPAYNEAPVVDELAKRLKTVSSMLPEYDFEMIVVENGSHDETFQKLMMIHNEDVRFKILQLSRNFGCDGGIAAGLQFAKGDAAVIMNADLQDPPEMIPAFVKKWEEGYEIVYGIIEKREGVTYFRRLLSSLAYRIINRMSGKIIPENVSDFRLIDRKVYTIINCMHEKNKFLRGLIAWTGFKQTGIPFERQARFAGESKGAFIPTFRVALNGIFSFSYLPLKIATVLGFLISVTAFVIAFYEIYIYLRYGMVVPGFYTTLLVILFCFGALFFLIGLLGMYVERIYDEVKQRPDFIVKNEIGFK